MAVYRATGLSRLFPHSPRFGRHNMGHLSAERVHEIDAGTSACLMLRRTAIAKVGFFDPAYFMYFEDIDLCYRLKQGGWKIFYIPSAEALHVKGASTSQEQRKALYQLHSANWTFHHKHYADELPAFGNGLVWAAIWARWAILTGWSDGQPGPKNEGNLSARDRLLLALGRVLRVRRSELGRTLRLSSLAIVLGCGMYAAFNGTQAIFLTRTGPHAYPVFFVFLALTVWPAIAGLAAANRRWGSPRPSATTCSSTRCSRSPSTPPIRSPRTTWSASWRWSSTRWPSRS